MKTKEAAIPAILIPVLKRVGTMVLTMVVDQLIEKLVEKLTPTQQDELSEEDAYISESTFEKVKEVFYSLGGWDIIQETIATVDPDLAEKFDNDDDTQLQVSDFIVNFIVESIAGKINTNRTASLNKKAISISPKVMEMLMKHLDTLLTVFATTFGAALANKLSSLFPDGEGEQEIINATSYEELPSNIQNTVDATFDEVIGEKEVANTIGKDDIDPEVYEKAKQIFINEMLKQYKQNGTIEAKKMNRIVNRLYKTAFQLPSLDSIWDMIKSAVVAYIIGKILDTLITNIMDAFNNDTTIDDDVKEQIENADSFMSLPDNVKNIFNNAFSMSDGDNIMQEALTENLPDMLSDNSTGLVNDLMEYAKPDVFNQVLENIKQKLLG